MGSPKYSELLRNYMCYKGFHHFRGSFLGPSRASPEHFPARPATEKGGGPAIWKIVLGIPKTYWGYDSTIRSQDFHLEIVIVRVLEMSRNVKKHNVYKGFHHFQGSFLGPSRTSQEHFPARPASEKGGGPALWKIVLGIPKTYWGYNSHGFLGSWGPK